MKVSGFSVPGQQWKVGNRPLAENNSKSAKNAVKTAQK